jgi:hypothetical protein
MKTHWLANQKKCFAIGLGLSKKVQSSKFKVQNGLIYKPSPDSLIWRSLISNKFKLPLIILILNSPQGSIFSLVPPSIAAPEKEINIRVIVNSNEDGEIRLDDKLTLREAILLVNGTISQERLSKEEKAQVNQADERSVIEFNLPPQKTAIALQSELPPLTSPGLAIDGTTQPGYNAALNKRSIPAPIVAITPASDKEILRGLTIVADEITIRGLSIYGFASRHRSTASTPPADIFISHSVPLNADTEAANSSDAPPKGVEIEANWLGMPPNGDRPPNPSTFGVSVFN